MTIKITIPNTSSDTLTFGSANTPTAAQIAGIDSGSSNGQLAIYTTASGTSTERVRVDSSGNVGIGTTSPSQKLHVQSAGNTYLKIQDTQTNGYNAATLYANDQRTFRLGVLGTAGGFTNGALVVYDETAAAWRMIIDSSGNLLVGTTTAGGGLFKVQAATDVCLAVASGPGVTGAITLNAINNANSNNIPFDIRASAIYSSTGIGTTASAANAYFNNAASNQFLRSTSALKYKTNIRDLENIDVNKFRPVRYNSLCEADDKTKEHFGIIADEVDAAGIKELVTYGEDNQIEGFQYERLTVVLLKAIQEQQALITALTARIEALEKK